VVEVGGFRFETGIKSASETMRRLGFLLSLSIQAPIVQDASGFSWLYAGVQRECAAHRGVGTRSWTGPPRVSREKGSKGERL